MLLKGKIDWSCSFCHLYKLDGALAGSFIIVSDSWPALNFRSSLRCLIWEMPRIWMVNVLCVWWDCFPRFTSNVNLSPSVGLHSTQFFSANYSRSYWFSFLESRLMGNSFFSPWRLYSGLHYWIGSCCSTCSWMEKKRSQGIKFGEKFSFGMAETSFLTVSFYVHWL